MLHHSYSSAKRDSCTRPFIRDRNCSCCSSSSIVVDSLQESLTLSQIDDELTGPHFERRDIGKDLSLRRSRNWRDRTDNKHAGSHSVKVEQSADVLCEFECCHRDHDSLRMRQDFIDLIRSSTRSKHPNTPYKWIGAGI